MRARPRWKSANKEVNEMRERWLFKLELSPSGVFLLLCAFGREFRVDTTATEPGLRFYYGPLRLRF